MTFPENVAIYVTGFLGPRPERVEGLLPALISSHARHRSDYPSLSLFLHPIQHLPFSAVFFCHLPFFFNDWERAEEDSLIAPRHQHTRCRTVPVNTAWLAVTNDTRQWISIFSAFHPSITFLRMRVATSGHPQCAQVRENLATKIWSSCAKGDKARIHGGPDVAQRRFPYRLNA